MRIGGLVLYRGRLHVLLGLDPTGVDDRRATLRDPASGAEIEVALAALLDPPPRRDRRRARFRL